MRIRALGGLACVLLLAASCGSEPSGDAGTPDPDTPTSNTPAPNPTGSIEDGAQRVVPDPGAESPRPHSYEKVKKLDEEKLRVFFYQGVAPCSVLDRVEVEYGTETVQVTLFVGSAPASEDVACIEIAVYNFVDVELDESIAGREILDGAA